MKRQNRIPPPTPTLSVVILDPQFRENKTFPNAYALMAEVAASAAWLEGGVLFPVTRDFATVS